MNFLNILLAGMGTFLTPCVYPLIPIYLSSLMGADMKNVKGIKRGQLFFRSLSFSMGFILVFSIMGLGASAISMFLSDHREVFQLVAGIFVLLFALKFLGIIEIPFMNKTIRKDDSKLNAKVGLLSAFLMGFFFAAGWSPCIGPILGSVLTYAASKTADPAMGVLYLTTYGVGFAIPLIITAIFAESGVGFIRKTSKFLPIFEKIIGVVMIFAALHFFSDLLNHNDSIASCQTLADPTKPNGKPLLVEFMSKNCGICTQMKPVVNEVQRTCMGKNIDIKVLDISKSKYSHLKKQYRLLGIPTFILFDKDGKEVSRLIGKQSKVSLLQGVSAIMGESCPAIGSVPIGETGDTQTENPQNGATCGSDNEAGVPLCTE
jgi:cytochrome c-type biogenesis protein